MLLADSLCSSSRIKCVSDLSKADPRAAIKSPASVKTTGFWKCLFHPHNDQSSSLPLRVPFSDSSPSNPNLKTVTKWLYNYDVLVIAKSYTFKDLISALLTQIFHTAVFGYIRHTTYLPWDRDGRWCFPHCLGWSTF